MKRKKEEPTHFWKELIDHIDKSWIRKKGIHYPFNMDTMLLKRLKLMCRDYQAWGVMSAWDIYMQGDSYWSRRLGFSLQGFFSDLAVLVDDPGWKSGSQSYMNKLEPVVPEIKELIPEKKGVG